MDAQVDINSMPESQQKDTIMSWPVETLITRENGEVKISDDDRRTIAIFRNGVCLCAVGSRWTPQTNTVLKLAKRGGYTPKTFLEVDPDFLIQIYASRVPVKKVNTKNLEARQREIAKIIARAAGERATDIHMRITQTHTEIRIRVNGRLKTIDSCDPDEGASLIKAAFAVAVDTNSNESELASRQGALNFESGLLPPNVELIRLQYAPTSGNRGALVARLKFRSSAGDTDLDTLGYAPSHLTSIARMRRRTNGLYIFAGKVSSGKSTTLQRSLNKMFLEKRKEISIYTIEEPVELDLLGAIQVPVRADQPGGGFAGAMRDALRMDPNVIVAGEIRSEETAHLAIHAVTTGHALWSTVHAGSALGILDRLVDLKVENWKLQDPDVVRGLIYQRLIGTICPHCRKTYREAVEDGDLEKDLAARFCRLVNMKPDDLYMRNHAGCDRCKVGLSGRTVVAEVLEPDEKMLDLYVSGKRMEMRQYWLKPRSEGGLEGMPVMHHALSKAGAGLVDLNEVEEEVDLLESYERDFSNLTERLRRDVRTIIDDRKGAV